MIGLFWVLPYQWTIQLITWPLSDFSICIVNRILFGLNFFKPVLLQVCFPIQSNYTHTRTHIIIIIIVPANLYGEQNVMQKSFSIILVDLYDKTFRGQRNSWVIKTGQAINWQVAVFDDVISCTCHSRRKVPLLHFIMMARFIRIAKVREFGY